MYPNSAKGVPGSTYTVMRAADAIRLRSKPTSRAGPAGNNFKFSTIEICFNNTVFLIQDLKNFLTSQGPLHLSQDKE